MSLINFPILYIPDPDKGRPLFNGQIYVGEPNLDPTVIANQKQLSVIQQDGTKVSVNQPLILSAGGVPTYNGNSVRLDVTGNYSIKILSKLGAQVYYIENVFEGEPATFEGIISDISQAYEFETVADMKASLLVFPISKKIITKGYFISGDGGGAEYINSTPDSDLLDVDGFMHHTMSTGTTAAIQIGEKINVKQGGMVADAFSTSSAQSGANDWALNEEAILNTSYTDNSDAHQAIFDFALRIPVRSPEVYYPAGAYAVTRPCMIHHADGLKVNGAGKISSLLVAVGDMNPILNTFFLAEQIRKDTEFTDPTDPGIHYDTEPCIFMIAQGRRTGANYSGKWKKQTDNANWSLAFENIGGYGQHATRSPSFIFAPEFAQSKLDNIWVEGSHTMLKSNDMYRLHISQCELNACFIPIDHFSTISYAHAQEESTEHTSNATGTSVHINACGASNMQRGWKFVHIPYSTMTCTAIDNWSQTSPEGGAIVSYAYDFERCMGMVMNGCGAEDFSDDRSSGLLRVTGGDEGVLVINGGVLLHPGNPAGTTGSVNILDGLSITINSGHVAGASGFDVVRGEVFLQGTSSLGLYSFQNRTSYYPIADNMPTANSRFIPSIHGSGKSRFSLFRVVAGTQTVTAGTTNGYKVVLDTGDSVKGFATEELGAMQASLDTIKIPYKGVYFVSICISHNALITNEIRLIKENPEGVKTKMIKYVTDSASRGVGDKTFTITAPFGQGDLIYLEVPQLSTDGTVYTVTTSVNQI